MLFRSRGGIITFGFLAVAALFFVLAVWITDGFAQVLVNLPFPAAVLVWGWWTWVWPIMEMSDRGLVLRNQLRTLILPWRSITGAESRFGLYVEADGKRYLAAGVPAKGGLTRAREDKETLPLLTFPKGIQQVVTVGPQMAARMVEEEKLYQDEPSRRPELSTTAKQNLRQWTSEGQRADSRFAPDFGDDGDLVIRWNWLPICLQAATLATVGLALVMR